MQRLLWDADGVAEASFGLWLILWWRRRLFPLRHWSPVNLSPVDIGADGRVLEEGVEFGGIVVHHVEEPSEHLDASALFLEELDNRLLFPLVGSRGVQW